VAVAYHVDPAANVGGLNENTAPDSPRTDVPDLASIHQTLTGKLFSGNDPLDWTTFCGEA
jgi:hypothetical protein